jgi:hypothetical protein
MKRNTFVFAIDPPIHAMIEGSLFSEDEHTALLKSLHHPFPVLESLCGASIGADETVAFVRELLEMALVPPEALGRRGVSHLAAFLAALPSKGQEIDGKMQSNSR